MHNTGHSKTAAVSSREREARSAVLAGAMDTIITLSALVAARSSVLLADFFKTGLELIAVLLAWLAIRRINRGAGARFEYGIGKLENLSSLFVGILMMICLLVISTNAVHNIMHPSHISGIGVWISMAAQLVYALVNGRLFITSRRTAKAESSPIMASQARLFMSKAFANVFILLSLILSTVLADFSWAVYIDPSSSLIIALFILLAALGTFSSSFNDLLDRTLEEESQIIILRELAHHFHEYDALHGIRSRRSGSHVFVEILLEFAPEKTVAEVQPVIDAMRGNLEKHIQGSCVTIGLTTQSLRGY